MEIIKSCFSLMVGSACGVYNVPNIRKLTNTGLVVAKARQEETIACKPKKDDH